MENEKGEETSNIHCSSDEFRKGISAFSTPPLPSANLLTPAKEWGFRWTKCRSPQQKSRRNRFQKQKIMIYPPPLIFGLRTYSLNPRHGKAIRERRSLNTTLTRIVKSGVVKSERQN
jgi:hypothetical protein